MKLNLREIGDNRSLPAAERMDRLENYVRDLVGELNVKLTALEKENADLRKRLGEGGKT
ncbi:MAG: hypothetical protein ACI3YH_03165 [Eubacteriales bacterium]